MAYLSREMELPGGQRMPMAGVLPVAARWRENAPEPSPATLQLRHDSWIGNAGTQQLSLNLV